MADPASGSDTTPRPIEAVDGLPLLQLNNDHAEALSYLEPDAFDALLASAWHARTLGPVGAAHALLVALDQGAGYDNPNFRWLKVRFNQFVYVDRIVVGAAAQGKGAAAALYHDLFAAARAAGHKRVVCEININPPNPGSVAFHTKLGFRQIGQQTLPNGKAVAYFECRLDV